MRPLSPEARRECLFLARKTLHAHVRRQQQPTPYQPVTPALEEPRGAFVTLRRAGELRGCVGDVEAFQPLWRTIERCTRSAASRDPRFGPVRPEELPELRIEISVLSPLQELADPLDFEVGRHGLLITQGAGRGLLLPQVAAGQGWSQAEFLDQACLKAGLAPGAWQSGARLQAFTADVFSEGEPPPA